jgi:hypothetical protein
VRSCEGIRIYAEVRFLTQNSQNEKLGKTEINSVTQKQLKEFVEGLRPLCVSIEKTPQGGYVVKPRREAVENPAALTRMYTQIRERGGSWIPTACTFTLPADSRLPTDPAQRALDLLKGVFSHSESEIGESLRVLMQAGMGTEEISQLTGAGRSTLYRYLRRQSKDSQNEKATADQSVELSACKSGSK